MKSHYEGQQSMFLLNFHVRCQYIQFMAGYSQSQKADLVRTFVSVEADEDIKQINAEIESHTHDLATLPHPSELLPESPCKKRHIARSESPEESSHASKTSVDAGASWEAAFAANPGSQQEFIDGLQLDRDLDKILTHYSGSQFRPNGPAAPVSASYQEEEDDDRRFEWNRFRSWVNRGRETAIVQRICHDIETGYVNRDILRNASLAALAGGIYIQAHSMLPGNHVIASYLHTCDGFIYPNAPRDVHPAPLSNFRNIILWLASMLIKVGHIERSKDKFRIGMWVLATRGRYKGDCGLIVEDDYHELDSTAFRLLNFKLSAESVAAEPPKKKVKSSSPLSHSPVLCNWRRRFPNDLVMSFSKLDSSEILKTWMPRPSSWSFECGEEVVAVPFDGGTMASEFAREVFCELDIEDLTQRQGKILEMHPFHYRVEFVSQRERAVPYHFLRKKMRVGNTVQLLAGVRPIKEITHTLVENTVVNMIHSEPLVPQCLGCHIFPTSRENLLGRISWSLQSAIFSARGIRRWVKDVRQDEKRISGIAVLIRVPDFQYDRFTEGVVRLRLFCAAATTTDSSTTITWANSARRANRRALRIMILRKDMCQNIPWKTRKRRIPYGRRDWRAEECQQKMQQRHVFVNELLAQSDKTRQQWINDRQELLRQAGVDLIRDETTGLYYLGDSMITDALSQTPNLYINDSEKKDCWVCLRVVNGLTEAYSASGHKRPIQVQDLVEGFRSYGVTKSFKAAGLFLVCEGDHIGKLVRRASEYYGNNMEHFCDPLWTIQAVSVVKDNGKYIDTILTDYPCFHLRGASLAEVHESREQRTAVVDQVDINCFDLPFWDLLSDLLSVCNDIKLLATLARKLEHNEVCGIWFMKPLLDLELALELEPQSAIQSNKTVLPYDQSSRKKALAERTSAGKKLVYRDPEIANWVLKRMDFELEALARLPDVDCPAFEGDYSPDRKELCLWLLKHDKGGLHVIHQNTIALLRSVIDDIPEYEILKHGELFGDKLRIIAHG
ncbi:hypothetical protein BT96DRAFT_946764 [Gymnopus androsaceus JB14]|uniref:Uncharacterized protein n=1 Tax=Gymnopus androsaceus JB14 TaxID=1447944 RepID=A0A6A4GUQ0_9AGAR|nr:hypothetical protein BT96DRAFT_946764 [Gymnopus androsaceus JB14]